MTTDSDVVYVGIPLTSDAVVDAGSAAKEAVKFYTTTESKASPGWLAFLVAAMLAVIGWVANQGWTIVSICIFGQFEMTLQSAWKPLLLSILGSICTAIAFWAVFEKIFRELDDDDDDEDGEEKPNPKKDIADALQDIAELGFVAGYLGAQTFLTTIVYQPLTGLGLVYDREHNISLLLNGATLVFLILWMLSTKLRDHARAVARASPASQSSDEIV